MKRSSSLAALGSALFLATACAHAQVLLNDTFSDGNRTGQTLPDSAAWYSNSGSSTTPDSSATVSGGALVSSARSVTAFFAASGAPVSLGIGDSIVLTFNVAYSAATDPTSTTALKVGLFNSNGGTRPANDGVNNVFSPYSGYAATYAYGSVINLRERPAGLTNTALFTSTSGYVLVDNGTTLALVDTPAPNYYAGTFTITRSGETAVTLSYSLTNVAVPTQTWAFSAIDTTPVTLGFDTVSFHTATGTDQYLDNVKVEFVAAAIPEPSTYAAIAGALALLGVWVQRRRRA